MNEIPENLRTALDDIASNRATTFDATATMDEIMAWIRSQKHD